MGDNDWSREKKNNVAKYLLRTLLVIFTAVLIVLVALAGSIYTLNYGPSGSAREIFVLSVRETSALKFMAKLVLPSDVVEEIIEDNQIEDFDVISNPDLITIPAKNDAGDKDGTKEEMDIEIVPVRGVTYSGRMMIVKDPSRVKVGVCTNIGQEDKRGEGIEKILTRYDALAGVNAGGFYDPNGQGTGTIPEGFVFSDGKLVYKGNGSKYSMVGFNKDNVMIVGKMTASEAEEAGIRDAVCFGPVLVQNGEAASIKGLSLNLNPRTAIGQREDGAVLILVIDGRQANSLGASYSDLIDVFLQFGAVNACNLDGGSSSLMYYEGKLISNPSKLTFSRLLPDCIYVEKRQ